LFMHHGHRDDSGHDRGPGDSEASVTHRHGEQS
jgi:hypothetical protein